MILKLALIRHGKTFGNTQGRYIGTTDEPLCQEGIVALQERAADYPAAELVFSSPMKRCIQTAGILYPGMEPYVLPDFRECDFGAFENKNYEELSGNPVYQAWIDSGGTLAFPQGESRAQVSERTDRAFRQMLKICRERRVGQAALVAHGGTIMTIMELFASPKRDYYDWQVKNGCGFLTEVRIEAGADVKTEASVRANAKAEAEVKVATEEKAEAGAGVNAKTGTEARIKSNVEAETETAAEIGTEVKERYEDITISVIAGISS